MAIAKGTTPIIGITRPHYIESLVRAIRMTLTSDDIAELEVLADAANVNTRGWWEQEMQEPGSPIQKVVRVLSAVT